MREIFKAGVTPQQKMVAVNNKFGNTDIKFQQGTTRCIYDTIQITAAGQTLRFFEDSASRTFPFSNTGSDGNKLGVGETMVIQSITFFVLIYDPATARFTTYSALNNFRPLQFADIDFEIANQRVIKAFNLSENASQINKNTSSATDSTIDLETEIVLPPLLNYVCSLKTAGSDAYTNTYVRCVINGAAGIIAPRTTF